MTRNRKILELLVGLKVYSHDLGISKIKEKIYFTLDLDGVCQSNGLASLSGCQMSSELVTLGHASNKHTTPRVMVTRMDT